MSTKKSRIKRLQAAIEFDEDEVEENEELLRLQKIKAPIVWVTLPSGFVIQDIPESRYDEVLTFIVDEYMDNDILCRCTYIKEDQESLESFLKQMTVLLNDKCSICAINTETKELAGILILRALHRSDYGKVYSRVKIKSGEAYTKICNVANHLNRKTDIFTKYSCDKFLRYYLMAVAAKYRHKAIGFHMLKVGMTVARSLKLDVVMGIFNANRIQLKAKKLGMEVLNDVYYVDWCENGEMIFDDPGPGNYTIALMAGCVPPYRRPTTVA